METPVKTKKKVQTNVPRREADFIVVARNAVAAWEKHDSFKLLWINANELKQAVTKFEDSFSVRNETKGSRKIVTQEIKAINAEIDCSVEYVKGYLIEIYSKKGAPAHYTQFGLVKLKNGYKLPSDNDKRLFALGQMNKAVSLLGWNNKKYGEAYWQNLYERFTTAKTQAAESDSTSATHVNIKTEQKATIKECLNALILLVKANYPHSWKEELRVWGFQKEKY